MKTIRVVVVSSENTPPSWGWIAKHIDTFDWSFFKPPKVKSFQLVFYRIITAFKAVRKAAQSDVLVSHGPYTAFYCALFKWLLRVRTPHIVYSFNFSELPQGFAIKRMSFAFNKIDRFVVSSHMEIDLYSDYFNLPANKFDFVRWGVNFPEFNNKPPKHDADYICAVGGNARDYATFIDTMRDLPHIPAIVVVRPYNLVGLQIPDNVTVLTNIPKDEAFSVIANSRLMVLPLAGNEIPCGHITLVVAYYLGIPSIVTNSSGIEDYVTDPETALLCAPGSKESMLQAVTRLWQDPGLCKEISQNCGHFAQTLCSEQNYVDHFKHFIEQRVTNND